MAKNITELKKQIEQKNFILNTIGKEDYSKKELIQSLEVELDGLLYQYFKLLKCS